MSVNITIGICRDDKRVVNKTIENATNIECELLAPCNMKNPRFVLNANIADFSSVNFISVPIWKRNYYIPADGVEFTSAGRVIITGECDVLSSFATEILSLQCNIIRQEIRHNPDFKDNGFTPSESYIVGTYKFSIQPMAQEIAGHCYMLTVVGGANNAN